MTRPEESLDFRLDRWCREARELATCSSCYGVGEDRHAPGRACPVCAGRGKAAREPHVLELVAMVRANDAEIEELSRARHSEQLRAERAELERDELRARVQLLEASRLRAVTVAALGQQAGERAAVEEAELRGEVDRLRGELYRVRDELHRARRGEADE